VIRLPILLVCLATAGCAAEVAQSTSPNVDEAATSTATAIPSVSATTASTASPTAKPSVTAPPTPGSSVITGFGFSDILRVEVNGLAVRVSPTLSSPLAQGIERAGDVRLDAGDYVSVELGRLAIGDVV
jgi:hypothetical protein